MRIKAALFIVFCIYTNPVYAGGFAESFAKGFLETSNETLERRRCEKTYSPAMCVQMEEDKRQKEAQARYNQQTEAELRQIQRQVNQLENENRNQRQQLQNMQNGRY